jgi:hypothetical protein
LGAPARQCISQTQSNQLQPVAASCSQLQRIAPESLQPFLSRHSLATAEALVLQPFALNLTFCAFCLFVATNRGQLQPVAANCSGLHFGLSLRFLRYLGVKYLQLLAASCSKLQLLAANCSE